MKILLCTDLDRTLLPNGPQPESSLARKKFNMLAMREEVTLAYVTGRDHSLVKKAINIYDIPQPDYVIADVGSTIYQVNNTQWSHLKEWDTKISKDWHGYQHAELHKLLSDINILKIQEYKKQNTHKLSYYVPLYVDHISLLELIESRLVENEIRANLIWSIDEAKNIGLLDILPASASKCQAIEFLMQLLGFSLEETIFSGDSGNDISVMTSQINSILVANASDDVKKQASRKTRENGNVNSLYLAKGDFYGMNGNYSAGILEGLVHYFPTARNWLSLDE